jgi:hypothetical protein
MSFKAFLISFVAFSLFETLLYLLNFKRIRLDIVAQNDMYTTCTIGTIRLDCHMMGFLIYFTKHCVLTLRAQYNKFYVNRFIPNYDKGKYVSPKIFMLKLETKYSYTKDKLH